MEIQIGKKIKKFDSVTADKLACNVGSGSVEVYATPMVIALIESAATELAKDFIPNDCTTVGTKINIEHISATAQGSKVYATAELIESDERYFEFYVEAYDNVGLIAKGTHQRVSVKTEKFLNKAKSKLS